MNEALQAQLLAAFEAELAEHLAAIRATIADASAGRGFDTRDASRRAHSLKGAARAVGQPRTEELAHEAETILLALEDKGAHPDAATLATLRRLADGIEDAARGDAPVAEAAAPDARVRVGGEQVDALVRSLHMLADQLADQATLPAQLEELRGELAWLARRCDRETGERLNRIAGTIGTIRHAQIRQQGEVQRTLDTLERDAERVMLVPVATLFDGYDRMVREIGGAQGKEVTLRIEGGEGEADRRVLQMLREPLLHILRNAVSHGIEPPDGRTAAGKSREGVVAVRIATGDGRLSIAVRDDGRGLDDRRIEARARSAGLIAADAPTPPRRQLRRLVFHHGFSTADTVDSVSGRGVGLSVVADIAQRLHGDARIGDAGGGGGAVVTLIVPLTITRQAMVVVDAGGQLYAIPSNGVSRVLHVDPARIEQVDRRERMLVDGESLPVGRLAAMANGAGAADALAALVLRVGDREAVLLVDRLVDVRATVVGDTAALAFDLPLVQGTARIEGRIVPVLRADALVDAAERATVGAAGVPVAQAPPPRRQTILVVDDSITTRTLERSILEAHGYRVLVSVDGLDGLDRLRNGEDAIDLVISDVEMPRLDGFGLLSAIRNDSTLQSLPVVMMTSRNRPDDVDRGLTLGANAYVTKQDFDQGALIDILQQLI